MALEQDAALVHVPEAQQQLRERGLARAAGADYRDALAALEPQAHAVESRLLLAGIAEAQRAQLEQRGVRERRGRGKGGLAHRGRRVHHLEQALRRGAHRRERVPGRGQRRHRLEGRERQQRHAGECHAVEPSGSDERNGERQHRDAREVRGERRERAARRRGAHQPALLGGRVAAERGERRRVGLRAPERQQIGHAVHAVHEPGRELPAQGQQTPAGRLAEAHGEAGRDEAGDREPERRGPGESERDRRQQQHEQAGNGDGREARPDEPRVEALQRPDVLQHAAEQVAAAVAHEPRRRERHERPEQRQPQARQQPQRHVVRREPLQVAQHRPRDAERAHADDRDRERRDRRVECGLREQPPRGAHQAHARGDGQRLHEGGAADAAPLGEHEPHEPDERPRQAVPRQAASSRG